MRLRIFVLAAIAATLPLSNDVLAKRPKRPAKYSIDAIRPLPGGLGLLPAPPEDPENPVTPAKVDLGKQLFEDTRLSGDELRDAEGLAPDLRVEPGGQQRRLGGRAAPGPAGQRRPQRLAPLGERGVDQGEHLGPGAVVSGGGRAGSWRPAPESTLGAGQKTVRPTAPARRTSAYQAALTEGTP